MLLFSLFVYMPDMITHLLSNQDYFIFVFLFFSFLSFFFFFFFFGLSSVIFLKQTNYYIFTIPSVGKLKIVINIFKYF